MHSSMTDLLLSPIVRLRCQRNDGSLDSEALHTKRIMNSADQFEAITLERGLKWYSFPGTAPSRITHKLCTVVLTAVTQKKAEMMKALNPFLRQNTTSASASCAAEAPLIYAVDDVPDLTELYITLLEANGYSVRAFNDRAEALSALKADRTKPDLLITDCAGPSMPVDRFMQRCLVVHPTLRILMASGFSRTDVRLSQARPDRFIQKPFTAAEFLRRVRAVLVA
jgi:CheY-like chemotaxis protein